MGLVNVWIFHFTLEQGCTKSFCLSDYVLQKQTKAASSDTPPGETSPKTSGATTPTKLNQKNTDELEENTPRNSNVKKSIAISPSALLSPSSWFKKSSEVSSQKLDQTKSPKSIDETDPRSLSKPPRVHRSKSRSDRNVLSPPSSSLFTTFTNLSSRHIKRTSNDDDLPPSPPTMTDASTASSLLWEDNTLISVSDEDAVAFRMFENNKMRSGDISPDEPLTSKNLTDKHADEGGHYEDHGFGGGRYYCDRHGNLRVRDFDGFDNVVLSVTIYATTSCQTHLQDTDPSFPVRQPTSGEVIVIELLSTKNPPDLNSSSVLQKGKQRKLSSSSSSQTNPPPPPSKESDSSTVSSSNSQHQSQIDEEDDDASSSHTRIIARRVFRWPSSIMSLDSKNENNSTMFEGKLYSNARGCPSLVSMGRTNICHEKRVTQKQSTANHESKRHCSLEKGHDVLTSRTNQEDRTDDALEAIRSLNFLFGESDPKTIHSPSKLEKTGVNVISNSDRPVTKKKIIQPLHLCFITNDGQVLFFHAMRVFLSRATNRPDRNVTHGFATFLFGNELLNKVCGDVLPLSQPDATVKLSQVSSVRNILDDSDWKTIVSCKNSSEVNEQSLVECEEQEKLNVWSFLADFDASIDPSSLRYRTLHHSNVITGTCTTSNTDNAFLAVCGKGLHRARHECYTLGGFVTFISLRHCNEAKTIYVPFAVESIQPVFWNGSHHIVLLGKEGTVKSMGSKSSQSVKVFNQMPIAVAIRVDSKERKQDTSLFLGRFQPIPINLPSISELVGSFSSDNFSEEHSMLATRDTIVHKAISISAIPSSPPGIILAVYSKMPQAPLLVIANCSLTNIQNGVLSTAISPGQRLCLHSVLTDSESDNCQDIWCTSGQVRA